MNKTTSTFFAPQLHIKPGVTDISFYEKAFGAIELRRWCNEDSSIHVAELSIEGAIFHVHEEKLAAGHFNPDQVKGTTVLVGLFTEKVDLLINNAVAAGAILLSAPMDYEYGYRQGEIKDPFGHTWLIEKKC